MANSEDEFAKFKYFYLILFNFDVFFPEIEREIMPTEAMTTQTYLYEEYHTQPTFNTDTDSQNKHTINNR